MAENAAQLEFFWRDDESFCREMEERAGMPLEVVLTDNVSTILSFKEQRATHGAVLRVHRMFLAADGSVLESLARWLTKGRCRRSARVIDQFIKANGHLVRPAPERDTPICTRGRQLDLQDLFQEVNQRFFGTQVKARITWGRATRGRTKRSIRLGSYSPEADLIRIHPSLDQLFVPEYVVRYVVFHEMLHAHLGIKESPTGRMCAHTPEFNRIERTYPDFKRAVKWHDRPRNLNRLLKYRPTRG